MKKEKKHLSYFEYWQAKGDYGKERIKRFELRKSRRKKAGLCKCGHNYKTPHNHSCPFDSDMYGNYEENCRCCSDCEHNCAMDI